MKNSLVLICIILINVIFVSCKEETKTLIEKGNRFSVLNIDPIVES